MLTLKSGKADSEVVFISSAGKASIFPNDLLGTSKVLDINLLGRNGLSIVSTPFCSYLWDPARASTRMIQDQAMELFFGLDPIRKAPALFKIRIRENEVPQQTFHYGVWTGTLNSFDYESSGTALADMVKRAWWPNVPNEKFQLSQSEIAWLFGPFFRHDWLAFCPERRLLSWSDHKIVWSGRTIKTFGAGISLNTISGNNRFGTVSVIENENPAIRLRDGTREYWDDSLNQGKIRERYFTYLIDMHTGKIIDVIPGVARVELCRTPE